MYNLYLPKCLIIFIVLSNIGCKKMNEKAEIKFLEKEIPSDHPIEFKKNLTPNDKLIHRGIFSPDF